ncbi:hypothetical protein QFZ37_000008 [Chryseobacterium ginsenosidimutans]|nr:hypothetical protein [Chryseobacterium ginsenosidimutans]
MYKASYKINEALSKVFIALSKGDEVPPKVYKACFIIDKPLVEFNIPSAKIKEPCFGLIKG